MKKIVIFSLILLSAGIFWGCKKESNYPGGTVSPYISLFDVRNIFKGNDITLTKENMFGADKITAVVISDHSGNNLPAGLLVVQDRRRLNQLRGIAIPIGSNASSYVPGDSVVIKVEGKILKRVNGMLQLTGVSNSDITKVGTGSVITPNTVKSNSVIANPEAYENTLISLTKVGFDPSYPPGSTYAGDRIINDGFGNMILHTEAGASFATKVLPFLSNFTGIAFVGADGKAQLWPRVESDITILSATAPKIASIVIAGYLADVGGSAVADANYEYIQLVATRNIDFGVTPFSIVTTNNAGTNTPTGFPVNGWATGGMRTYKINLTSGTVAKGQIFYIGANKNINGPGTTDISASKWFTKMYSTDDGDGFGTKTSNLLANSGNAAGIAIFDKTAVDETTVPVDVIFYGGAGSIFTAGPPARGYRITNTDYYDEKNPTTQADQPFYAQGTNTSKLAFPTGGSFAKLTGTYNRTSGRWTSARQQTSVALTPTSAVTAIEGGITIEE